MFQFLLSLIDFVTPASGYYDGGRRGPSADQVNRDYFRQNAPSEKNKSGSYNYSGMRPVPRVGGGFGWLFIMMSLFAIIAYVLNTSAGQYHADMPLLKFLFTGH